jgi:hypothetical protein
MAEPGLGLSDLHTLEFANPDEEIHYLKDMVFSGRVALALRDRWDAQYVLLYWSYSDRQRGNVKMTKTGCPFPICHTQCGAEPNLI